jgi:two-component system, NtrC family, sensor histidine kinase HydH
MFRVRESEGVQGFSLAQRFVQVILLLALLANSGSAYVILQEDRRLDAWLDDPESVPATVLESLRHEVRLQFALSLTVSAILVFCLISIWWLRRRYLASERSLRQVKMLAHDILTSMDQGVITVDQQGCVTSINTAGIRLLGVDLECVGRPLASISCTEVPLEDLSAQVAKNQAPVRDRDFAVNSDGRVLRLRGDAHILSDTEGATLGCVIHLRNMTERVLIEERMRRMERFISLGTLASGLHHEIKNPLTALSIHLQLLEERLADPQSTQPVDDLVGVLKTEVYRLSGVLDSFRSFANLQRLTVLPTDARSVLENTIRLVRPQAAQQQVEVVLSQPNTALPLIPLDADKFEQAVLNLVINALEAMPAGGTLTLDAAVQENWFQVRVTDTGPGIPPEIQKNLFQPYFSAKSTGTGMGLALSEKLISQHGGHIDYRTGAGGTTFRISVPLEQQNGNA